MSGGIRVRRVADPLPIQRGPPPQSSNFDDLATAWNNHAEANNALQRAEARLEEAETYHPGSFNINQDPSGLLSPGYKRYLGGMEDHGSVRVPVDRVPTVEFGDVQHRQVAQNRVSRAKYGKDRARKRVTIVDNFEWDKPSLHPALSPPRSDRDPTRNLNSLSPSRSIDNNQIQRLENQLKSLSHTLKSSAYDSKTTRSSSPRRGNYMYDDLPADRNWTNGSSHLESFERRTSPKGNVPSPSSQEILSRGSANLSVDNSTAIRVLNDLPPSQHPSEKERNQRNYEFREDYVPAYERMYGTQPMDKLANRQDSFVKEQNDVELRQTEAIRQRVRASRKLAAGSSASSHMDRLRERVEEQKAGITIKGDGLDRVWHREGDPVVLQDPDGEQNAFTDFSVPAGKSTVRKVAAAPAAPAYRGFSEVETRFKMPDGKILTEENLLLQKTSRKSHSHRNKTVNQNVQNAADRALKPSLALHQQNRPEQSSKPSRTVRKVHKASKALERRPKRPERKDIISTTSWRDGQKTVLKILGPPEKPVSVPKSPAPHSPPTHDTEEPPSPRSLDLVIDVKTKDEVSDAELSEHPLEPEEVIEEVTDDRPGPSLGMNNLPSEAKNVLEDLNLSPSDSEDETSQPEKQRRKRESQPPSKSFKKNKSAKASQQDKQILPVERIRHYDTDHVRKYMAKQKADRRRKLQEDKKERKLAQDRKQEQLRELSKKQKESVRTCQRNRDTTNNQLGETFSKGPVAQEGGQLNGYDQLPRHHLFRQDGKKIDVTSSDKENKNIWSTSSSDSSIQSNLPSDTPHSPSEHTQPPAQFDHPGRLNDMAESQGQPPRQSSPIGVVVTQMAGGMSDGGQIPQSDPGQRAEVKQPAAVRQGLKNNAPLPPASTSVPAGISTVARSRSDRIQALKATAAALQGKIDNEVRKLTVDIHTPVATSPGEAGRWAYPAGNKTATPSRAVHFSGSAVESPAWVDDSTVKASRYQRMVGNDYNHRVFTGSLPGTSNLSAQAQQAQTNHHQDQAARRIQAAFRGHSVRQRLQWSLPSGRTLGDAVKRRAPESIPEVHVSSAERAGPLRGRGAEEDDASLSEGPLSDGVPDYMPTFKSLPTKHSHVYQSPPGTSPEEVYVSGAPLTRPTSLLGATDRWKESLADGLSVINIFTRKYQNANRAVLYGQLPDTTPSPKGSPIGYSYNDDFTGASSTSSKPPKTKQEEASAYSDDFSTSSKSKTRPKGNSSTTSPSSKSSYKTTSSHKRSSRSEVNGQTQNRKMDDNTLDLSPNESFGSSGDDFHQRKCISRTPSPKPSSASFHTKSISDQRSSPSLLSPTASLGSKAPSSPDSTVSSGSLSRSPVAENQSGQSSGGSSKFSSSHSKTSGGKSRSKSKSSSRSSRGQGSAKEGLNLLRPVSSGSSVEMNGDRGVERKSSRSGLDPRPSTSGKPPLPSQYSPAALSLKMASELNLLESLEESVRQISEMERTRHVSLAQQESVSLARVLQARQRDHEREIQLLSLKARQEVEEANKQLEVVRQRAVETASDAERVLAQARREATDARSDTTRRLIESQAEAAKVTAEAAKQMAEAQRMPAQLPMPSIDPNKLATDTATAATSAAVTAALEQQRLHQIEFLKEMKGALAPPAAVHTRSLGVGENSTLPGRQSSQLSYTSSSRSDTPHSPKPEYTDDFTESAKSQRSSHSLSTGTIPEASSLSVTDQLRSARSAKSPTNTDFIQTASSLSVGQDNSGVSIKTDSALSPVKSEYSPSIGNSSIHTASNISGGSTVRSPSISEDIPDNKQSSYSSYSSDTRSKTSSSGTSPTSSSTPVRPKEDKSKMMTTYDVRQPQAGNFTLGMDDSFTRLSAEMLKQQLRDEEVRSQQQGALFKLREKTLLEKAKVELEWLEHEKRRHKEKGDSEALQSARKRQQALVAKVQQEQAEMRRLRAAQKAASHERQLFLFQQQEILRMRKATEAVKDHMKDLSNISITSSIGGALGEDHPSNASTVVSPDLPEVLSDSNGSIESPGERKGTGLREELHGTGTDDEKDGGPKGSLTPAEKQAQVMQKLKKLQQPLSMKYLTKREQQLTKRRRNAEELLAWQRRLDEEESQILTMEREAMRRLDNTKPRPPMKALPPATPRDSAHDSSPRLLSDDISEGSISVTPSRKDGVRDGEGQRRESGESVTENISHSSSVPEDIVSETSKKMSSPRIPTASNMSSDDTLTHTKSIPEDYASDSFDTADHTLTPTKSLLGPQRSSSTLESFRAPLSPHRRIMESESGSESEKSFSQTVSEIASDQSDVEGRVKALEVELRKRKMEAEKLRRQQKRMQREKLKAQEASLKKQLESYEKLIEKTKAELKTESEAAPKTTSVTVKPQIKQPRVSESQRLKDRSHARSLRQRTASDSSREGGAELGSIRKKRSVSEGSVSSRSSVDDEAGSGRDPSYSSFSSVFTPPTTPRHAEDTTPAPLKTSTPTTKPERNSFSPPEEASVKTANSVSDEDSQRAIMDKKTEKDVRRQKKGPQQSEDQEGLRDSSVVSEISEEIQSAYSSASATPDEVSLKESPRLNSSREPQVNDELKSQASLERELSEASSVPEEVLSTASSASLDSVRSTPRLLDLHQKDNKRTEPPKPDNDGILNLSGKGSPSRLPVSSIEDLSQRSELSYSSSVRTVSSHRSRTHSEQSGVSYSDEFVESSVSVGVKNKESLSDTDDDISEQLSIASEPSEVSVTSGGKLTFNLAADKGPDERTRDTPEAAPEVTISERKLDREQEDSISEEEERTPVASPNDELLEISQDFTGYEIGDRVIVNNKQKGSLLFKGVTHFAPGPWGGVELDEPQGTNDGSLDGHVYFHCKASHGMFVTADRLEHLTKESPRVESKQDSSIEEDVVSMVSEGSEPEQRKQHSPVSSLSSKTPSESMKPLAQVLKSEATDEDSVAEDFSEPMTDDAALARLINSAAAAVESFHEEDIKDMFPTSESAETPRGAPEQEVAPTSAKERLVDSITDQLTVDVLKDTVKTITGMKQTPEEDVIKEINSEKTPERSSSTERPSTSLLKMLVPDDAVKSPRDEVSVREVKVDDKDKEEQETRTTVIRRKIDSTTEALLTDAVTELISLRRKRSEKQHDELKSSESLPGSPSPSPVLKSPSPDTPSASPFVRNTTPYTPDSESPVNLEETTLDDDIFINRVKVETNHFDLKDQDQVPVARPGSPVFGEPSGINPEALSERLEQMQQLGADIFEGDLFGEQEWFDDDFGSMPKSKSIIQVPVRNQDTPIATPIPGTPVPGTPVPGTPEINRLDLTRIAQEPFYAVPHNRKEVKSLVDQSIRVFHEKALQNELTSSISPPQEILGDDSKGSDIESTSRKSYKRLVFNLVGEAYQDITGEQELGEQPLWMKPKRRPRKYFFDRPPRELPDIARVVEDRALFVTGLTGRPKIDPAMNRFGKKKKDHVDEILTLELREEEQEWVDYDDDELAVKMQLTEAIFDSLLTDTAMVLNRIQDRRKARISPVEPEIEF